MNRLIAILTGLHVLAHGVFGCCDHGALADVDAARPCACHHAHGHVEDVPAAGTCKVVVQTLPARAPHQCIHASCHWIAGSAAPSVAPLDFSIPALLATVPPAASSALNAAEFQPDDVLGRTSALPLRLHLVLGVLVV